MSQNLSVTVVQSNLIWENPKLNRDSFEEKFKDIKNTNLIILPEMFTTGFTMNPEGMDESMTGETVNWLKKMAHKLNAAIVGSFICSENEKFYNRLLFVHPSGEINTYDKRHLFTLAGEHTKYTAGKHKLVVDYLGWKICPLICYDLRFPVWARNVEEYDLLVYVANWPKVRIKAWDTLLKARAIENISYSIGVNRIGTDGNNFEYNGHSAIYDYLGNEVSAIKESEETVYSYVLNKQELANTREKLNFLNDKDSFIIQ